MKKNAWIKIISHILILLFVVSTWGVQIEVTQAANDSGLSNYYSNPNQGYSNKNPYKFKVTDVVNSNLLTNIVGCTGIVNKVSTWMSKFIQSPLKIGKMLQEEKDKAVSQAKNACSSIKQGAEYVAGSLFGIDQTTAVDTSFEKFCAKVTDAKNDKEIYFLLEEQDATRARDFKEQCFDGIALTLARNQLTSMARSAMNWVNSGYGGNPFFVQSMRNLTTGIEQNVIETGINILTSPEDANPYATEFSRSIITSRNLLDSSAGFLGNLQSSLEYFITDPQSSYSNKDLNAAERSRMATDAYANNFSLGGWNGWLAFTQMPQNNPLGFNMMASQYLADTQNQQIQEKKDELAQNNGFLSQKVCIKWQIYDGEGKPKRKPVSGGSVNSLNSDGTMKTREEINKISLGQMTEFIFSNSKPNKIKPEDGYGECVDWKVTTPGSIIRDKTTNYLNSPERQLELARTINDSLNALFSVLISKLQGNGLSGLSDSASNTTNWTDNLNTFISSDGNTAYNNDGAYNGFNLTKDLGNTYIHANSTYLGEWNAKTNTTSKCTNTKELCIDRSEDSNCLKIETTCGYNLYSDLAPDIGDGKILDNIYFNITTEGKTKLLSDGYNAWEKGDRVFWDGSKWQNWKCKEDKNGNCTKQPSPIARRGVVQVQQDYIVAAKEILKVLPGIMPALGELDYCLPGPNPNYKINSSNAQSAYSDWVGTMYVGAVDNTNERWGVKIDNEGDRTYEDFHNIFYGNEKVWDFVKNEGGMKSDNVLTFTVNNIIETFSNMCNQDFPDNPFLLVAGYKNFDNCKGNYTYIRNGNFKGFDNDNISFKQKIIDDVLNYTNNFLFKKFYEVFDIKMNKKYFKNITNPYMEREDRTLNPNTDKNPAYVPMAESGYDFTKNIVSYGDDTVKAQKDYNDAISQANVNISKLTPIMSEVSSIIKKAQERRNDELAKKLGITTTKLAKDYASCMEEENIKFYDVGDIMGSIELRSAESCFDGIDNDLNGLTDSQDPACGGTGTDRNTIRAPKERTWTDSGGNTTSSTPPSDNTTRRPDSVNVDETSLYGCAINNLTTDISTDVSTKSCAKRSTENECLSGRYAVNGLNYLCRWDPSLVN